MSPLGNPQTSSKFFTSKVLPYMFLKMLYYICLTFLTCISKTTILASEMSLQKNNQHSPSRKFNLLACIKLISKYNKCTVTAVTLLNV
jgi:hypothetical protein